jgi:hypothetical protein
MKAYSGDIAPSFLTSGLDGDVHLQAPAALPLRETSPPGTHWRERRLSGLQSQYGRYEEKNLLPLPGIEPRPSSLSLYRLTISIPLCYLI